MNGHFSRKYEAMVSEQKYLDRHGFLQVVQGALRLTASHQPEDPFSFMAQLLLVAAAERKASEVSRAKVTVDQLDETVNTGVQDQSEETNTTAPEEQPLEVEPAQWQEAAPPSVSRWSCTASEVLTEVSVEGSVALSEVRDDTQVKAALAESLGQIFPAPGIGGQAARAPQALEPSRPRSRAPSSSGSRAWPAEGVQPARAAGALGAVAAAAGRRPEAPGQAEARLACGPPLSGGGSRAWPAEAAEPSGAAGALGVATAAERRPEARSQAEAWRVCGPPFQGTSVAGSSAGSSTGLRRALGGVPLPGSAEPLGQGAGKSSAPPTWRSGPPSCASSALRSSAPREGLVGGELVEDATSSCTIDPASQRQDFQLVFGRALDACQARYTPSCAASSIVQDVDEDAEDAYRESGHTGAGVPRLAAQTIAAQSLNEILSFEHIRASDSSISNPVEAAAWAARCQLGRLAREAQS